VRKPKLPSRKRILLATGLAVLVIFVSLPFIAGTSTYPVTVVNGNSMSPTLHNGDLVFFDSPAGRVKNGTIIVFVQSQSGVPALDSWLMPVVIHRVVGIGTEPDGTADYRTKGDNNLQDDPFVTDSQNVLGVPVLVIPYVGYPIQFLKTPYGMVAVTALISLYFFSEFDTKFEEEQERDRLVAVFARHTLNGDITAERFERLKLAVEYYDEIPTDQLTDPVALSLVDWLKGGTRSTKWKEELAPCPTCGGKSFGIINQDKSFLVCPACSRSQSPMSA
jgi:signal peptidase